ncbi:hypothetical protein Dimus_032464 [Dionaea muscipula]
MNDYKVVLIRNLLIPETTEHVSVYSLRSDSWKSLNRPHRPEFYLFAMPSTTSSGGRMLNWLGLRRDMDYHHRTVQIVISFDLTEETFVMTPMPPETECKCGRKHQSCCLIQNTQDGPCTIVCFPPDHKIDDERDCLDNGKIINIWSLNEYGDSGSWTKLLSLVMFDNYVWLDHFVFWKGGEVLFEIKQHKGKLQQASYNPITRQLRLIRLKGRPCLGYTESLVSINGRYGRGLLLDDPNRSIHDVKNIDDSRKKQNYYYLVDDSTGRTISRLHMTEVI